MTGDFLMSNNWNIYSCKIETTETTFDNPVSGGRYLQVGLHENAKIDGVELAITRTNEPYVKFVWTNAEGQTHRDSIFLYSFKDGNRDYHFTLKRLASGLIEDRELRMAFFKKLVSDPSGAAFNSLVGFRANVSIGNGRKGYVVNKVDTGGYVLFDMGDKKNVDEKIFDSYTAANEWAKELGLERSWPEVKVIAKPSDEYATSNETAARLIVESAEGSSSGSLGNSRGVSRLRGPAI